MTALIAGGVVLVVNAKTTDEFALIAQIDFVTVAFVVHFTEPSLLFRPEYRALCLCYSKKRLTWSSRRTVCTDQSCIPLLPT
jgi:hypothetical protein